MERKLAKDAISLNFFSTVALLALARTQDQSNLNVVHWLQIFMSTIFQGDVSFMTIFRIGGHELMKPLKRVFCWIIGHNWLSSRYDLLLGRGGSWECGRCGKFSFSLKQ